VSFGKIKTFIDIIETQKIKDESGFVTTKDIILASVRAYKEIRSGTEKWANRAAFSTATALFRFRKIPGIEITTKLFIVCDTGRYNILSVEDVRNRGMYTEVLCDEVVLSGKL
jgi:head-tail adaptor